MSWSHKEEVPCGFPGRITSRDSLGRPWRALLGSDTCQSLPKKKYHGGPQCREAANNFQSSDSKASYDVLVEKGLIPHLEHPDESLRFTIDPQARANGTLNYGAPPPRDKVTVKIAYARVSGT